ncbi:hypothetical protein RvY_03024 [Ramazzottius varieornatus]|uniref:Uncharacterized protein n=1 Tax=Ramazzottius varieornatus TaxID=947166 RepID=A0A1D1UQG3_RAMVA|nr:hypothetical protein RvY_03024 [Ramazzottius varieornatus]
MSLTCFCSTLVSFGVRVPNFSALELSSPLLSNLSLVSRSSVTLTFLPSRICRRTSRGNIDSKRFMAVIPASACISTELVLWSKSEPKLWCGCSMMVALRSRRRSRLVEAALLMGDVALSVRGSRNHSLMASTFSYTSLTLALSSATTKPNNRHKKTFMMEIVVKAVVFSKTYSSKFCKNRLMINRRAVDRLNVKIQGTSIAYTVSKV